MRTSVSSDFQKKVEETGPHFIFKARFPASYHIKLVHMCYVKNITSQFMQHELNYKGPE